MAADDPIEVENWVRQRVLGSGGFGVVSLWKHKETNEMIALKKCRTGTDVLLTPKHKERWTKEVEIMQRLCHPNVVRAIAVPPDLAILRSELPLLCMEFCSKGDLRQILNRAENCCGLREVDVRALIKQVKSAVEYLHYMKITHRDLKPENIVLQQIDNQIVYKLIDLGYAKELDNSSICTSFVGTLQYLAPELFLNKSYTSSVDYWSLGLVSHEAITGVRPFLPNMPPVSWMNYVRQKSSEDISAYQAPDGTIVFCKELYQQNHISGSLKYYMEQWLKYLLEWDPKKRGKDKNSKIIVFEMLDEILKKKIVHIFCVPLYKNLSYEVNESTALSTLKTWIERDTGLAVDRQELLLANGNSVDSTKEAIQCWIPECLQDCSPMAFVFNCGEMKLPEVTPDIPATVGNMLMAPKSLMEYVHQKRAWGHSVFFLQQENELYNTFIRAYRVKMFHILQKSNHLTQLCQQMCTELNRVEALHYLSSQIISCDLGNGPIRSVPEPTLQMWATTQKRVNTKVESLRTLVNGLQSKTEAVRSKVSSLQASHYFSVGGHDRLQIPLELARKCYDTLRKKPKDRQHHKQDSVEMVKVVIKCLKERDILLRDADFNNHLQIVAEVQTEVQTLLEPVTKTLNIINTSIEEIVNFQIDRQNAIWMMIPLQPSNGMMLPPVIRNQDMLMNQHLHASNTSVYDQVESTSSSPSFVPSFPPISNNEEAVSMIQDNLELRHQTMEKMTETYQSLMKIVADNQEMDFSYLNM